MLWCSNDVNYATKNQNHQGNSGSRQGHRLCRGSGRFAFQKDYRTERPSQEDLIANPEAIEQADWEYLTSEAYLLDLMAKDSRGEVPDVPETAVLFEPNTMTLFYQSETPSGLLREYGIEPLFEVTNKRILACFLM